MIHSEPLWLWLVFSAVILLFLWIDLALFNRRPHAISIRESLVWTVVWVVLALAFCVFLYAYYGYSKIGGNKALEFLTGFVVEKSLSVDNLFVILLIFQYFGVDPKYQHRVLFWGLFGALAMRLGLILLGVNLIARFHAVIYLLGGFLVVTAVRVGFGAEHEIHPDRNIFVRIFRRFFPVSSTYDGPHFFTHTGSRWIATPLFVVLIVIEATDLVFAIDSIPAILAISQDPFIVYSSNAFAILGLRSLFFALAGVMNLFVYLRYGLAVILGFIGAKMLLSQVVHISTGFSLIVVLLVLLITVVWSLRHSNRQPAEVEHVPASSTETISE
ncbi:MAG: membrane protein [Candidatus Kapaibacterium sp.]|nr:MAG: membrane protein [Candidatus Kapabacteria bacterium]